MTLCSCRRRFTFSFCNAFGLGRVNFSTIAAPQLERPISVEPAWEECPKRGATQLSNLHALLQLSARNRAAFNGKASHAKVILYGLQADTLTSNMVINLYSKCGLLRYARMVFDGMPERSLVSWNTIIGSYTQNGQEKEALRLFLSMQREGNPYSEFTISSVLCACAAKCAIFECQQLHGFAIKAVMDSNMFVGTALLNVYAKSGLLTDASRVFGSLPEKSVVTWTCMVTGYVQNELYEEALLLFRRVLVMGLEQNQFTFSSIFCACAGLAALIEGKQVHAVLFKTGFDSNVFVASSLIDMYAKCGNIREAYAVFTSIERKNVVSWNVMISAFAKHARSLEAMVLFEKLQLTGLCPNELTYIALLSACSHGGWIEEAQSYFDLMTREHNVSPNIIHYSCMVDILSRAGKICKAHDLIKSMPFGATASMWGSLLSSCRVHGNLELAVVAAKHLFAMEPNNPGNHILLSNVYAANSKWEEVAETRKFLKESEVKKESGKSWIEIKDKVHTFMVGERTHPRISEIYLKLDDLVEEMKLHGYNVETEHDLHDVEESGKQLLLRHHSEKLALSFGLMCLPPSAPIRVLKNLRICGDCHSFMKFASKITGREIVVRDINRFHHFRDGYCSCGDFW